MNTPEELISNFLSSIHKASNSPGRSFVLSAYHEYDAKGTDDKIALTRLDDVLNLLINNLFGTNYPITDSDIQTDAIVKSFLVLPNNDLPNLQTRQDSQHIYDCLPKNLSSTSLLYSCTPKTLPLYIDRLKRAFNYHTSGNASDFETAFRPLMDLLEYSNRNLSSKGTSSLQQICLADAKLRELLADVKEPSFELKIPSNNIGKMDEKSAREQKIKLIIDGLSATGITNFKFLVETLISYFYGDSFQKIISAQDLEQGGNFQKDLSALHSELQQIREATLNGKGLRIIKRVNAGNSIETMSLLKPTAQNDKIWLQKPSTIRSYLNGLKQEFKIKSGYTEEECDALFQRTFSGLEVLADFLETTCMGPFAKGKTLRQLSQQDNAIGQSIKNILSGTSLPIFHVNDKEMNSVSSSEPLVSDFKIEEKARDKYKRRYKVSNLELANIEILANNVFNSPQSAEILDWLQSHFSRGFGKIPKLVKITQKNFVDWFLEYYAGKVTTISIKLAETYSHTMSRFVGYVKNEHGDDFFKYAVSMLGNNDIIGRDFQISDMHIYDGLKPLSWQNSCRKEEIDEKSTYFRTDRNVSEFLYRLFYEFINNGRTPVNNEYGGINGLSDLFFENHGEFKHGMFDIHYCLNPQMGLQEFAVSFDKLMSNPHFIEPYKRQIMDMVVPYMVKRYENELKTYGEKSAAHGVLKSVLERYQKINKAANAMDKDPHVYIERLFNSEFTLPIKFLQTFQESELYSFIRDFVIVENKGQTFSVNLKDREQETMERLRQKLLEAVNYYQNPNFIEKKVARWVEPFLQIKTPSKTNDQGKRNPIDNTPHVYVDMLFRDGINLPMRFLQMFEESKFYSYIKDYVTVDKSNSVSFSINIKDKNKTTIDKLCRQLLVAVDYYQNPNFTKDKIQKFMQSLSSDKPKYLYDVRVSIINDLLLQGYTSVLESGEEYKKSAIEKIMSIIGLTQSKKGEYDIYSITNSPHDFFKMVCNYIEVFLIPNLPFEEKERNIKSLLDSLSYYYERNKLSVPKTIMQQYQDVMQYEDFIIRLLKDGVVIITEEQYKLLEQNGDISKILSKKQVVNIRKLKPGEKPSSNQYECKIDASIEKSTIIHVLNEFWRQYIENNSIRLNEDEFSKLMTAYELAFGPNLS